MAEPNPTRGRVRTSTIGRAPIADTLQDIREVMTGLTVDLVKVLGQRCTYAVGAVDFKANPEEVKAPNQRDKNVKNAVEVAQDLYPGWKAFHAFIERVVTVVSDESIIMQEAEFPYTIPIDGGM